MSEKDKIDKSTAEAPRDDAANGQPKTTSQTPPAKEKLDFDQLVGAYSKKYGHAPDLSEKSWGVGNERYSWGDRGKLIGRRFFSRGVPGGIGFVVGGAVVGRALKHYSLESKFEGPRIDQGIQMITRGIDHGIGTPLKKFVNLMGHDGEKFVNSFRPMAKFDGYSGKYGRTLGHEFMGVTGDFATMSIGDFWGRKVFDTLDPNQKRVEWRRKDGSIDWGKAIKTFGKNWWTAITYSAGEDIAVGISYVVTMRHIGAPVMNKLAPGFIHDFSNQGQGGSFKIDDNSHITGTFTGAGVLNFAERFTTYNIGTLMFREAYHWTGDRISHAFNHKPIPPIVEPNPENPNRSGLGTVVDGSKQFANWIARSALKATMYMIPSATIFGLLRAPQFRYKGQFIHPEKGPLYYLNADNKPLILQFNSPIKEEHIAKTSVFHLIDGKPVAATNPFSHGLNARQPYAKRYGYLDHVFHPIGEVNEWIYDHLRKPLGNLITKFSNSKRGGVHADTYLKAFATYPIYFAVKSDYLADKWDNGRMDVSIDRTLSGIAHLKPGEFGAGVGEIWQSLKNQPLKDPAREMYAECRIVTDETPSDNKFLINPNAGESCDFLLPKFADKVSAPSRIKEGARTHENRDSNVVKSEPELSWQERLIQGKAEDKLEIGSDKPKSYSEQQKMREALAKAQPPTNSIN